MKKRAARAVVRAAAFLLLAMAMSLHIGQAPLEIWSADPSPVATVAASPLLPEVLHPEEQASFIASGVADFDTRTVVGGGCSAGSGLVADTTESSRWTIFDPTYEGGIVVAEDESVEHTVQAWEWPDESYQEGGATRAMRHVGALFTVDDGRLPSDDRHDTGSFVAGSVRVAIPNAITTAPGEPMCRGTLRCGHTYSHALLNTAYPAKSFGGMEISESIVSILCDVCLDEAFDGDIQSIISDADGTWTIQEDNTFGVTDKHCAGPSVFNLLDGGGDVTLLQVYRIESWGWGEKNAEHHIGRQVGFSFLSGVHTIVFQQISNSMVLAHKDRLTDSGEFCEF